MAIFEQLIYNLIYHLIYCLLKLLFIKVVLYKTLNKRKLQGKITMSNFFIIL